jgi:hypothetical protein
VLKAIFIFICLVNFFAQDPFSLPTACGPECLGATRLLI